MSADFHAKVRELFLAASTRPAPERQAFIDESCGDDEALRSEVESLLSHHEDVEEVGATVAEPISRSTRPEAHRRIRFEPGQVFAGRYRILAELGRGGMGEVFHAHDLVLDEAVAIKFLPRPKRQHVEHLLNEVRMARQVTHPNVCRVFDFGEADGETYLTIEFVDGENLASLLARIGRLSRDKLLDLAQQLAAGLAAAHARGVLHRDLKPANIMVNGRGQARITDFGIASSVESGSEAASAKALSGTPAYMAPEQLGSGDMSVQSDLYALGLVLYEMATGRPVFEASTPAEYAELHRASTPAPPAQEIEHLDPYLEAVIVQCIEKDPQDRPASALAVAAALPGSDRLQLALEAGETPSPEVVAAAGRGEVLNHRRIMGLAGGLGVLLIAIFYLADSALPGRGPWSSKPPEVLAERAMSILHDLGYDEPPADRAWGFVKELSGPAGEAGWFWYRQAREPLEPMHLFVMRLPRVDFYDPFSDQPGMARLLLDPEGNLVRLHVVPTSEEKPEKAGDDIESDESTTADAEGTTESPTDWTLITKAAGLDPATLTPAEPGDPPPLFADQRIAWEAPEGHPAQKLQAAAYRGRVVYFDARPEDNETPASSLDFDALWNWYLNLAQVFWFLLTFAAIFLARANIRSGRGDLRGARRLAFFVIGTNLVIWVLETDHVPTFSTEAFYFEANLGRILLDALVAWLAYIALEPTVRRWWPRALIAWSRLLRGQVMDPAVGSSLLIGTVVGTFWVLATYLDRLAARWFDLDLAAEIFIQDQLNTALSGRLWIAATLDSLVNAFTHGVLGLFFLVALRVALKRWWLAVVVFVATYGLFDTLEGIHPAVSWLTLGVGIAGVSAFVLVRGGLLAYTAGLFCYWVLLEAPVTASWNAWFAETSLFALAVVAGLGIFGGWIAWSRQTQAPVLGESTRSSSLGMSRSG